MWYMSHLKQLHVRQCQTTNMIASFFWNNPEPDGLKTAVSPLLLGFSKHQNVCQGRANKEFKNAGSKIHKYNVMKNSGTTCFYVLFWCNSKTPLHWNPHNIKCTHQISNHLINECDYMYRQNCWIFPFRTTKWIAVAAVTLHNSINYRGLLSHNP